LPRRRRAAVFVTVALLAAVSGGFVAHLTRDEPGLAAPAAGGLDGAATRAPGRRPAPQITTLHDQNGRAFSLPSLRGRTVAVAFFDSHCHAECPLEGRALATAERALSAARRPVLVAISVNPADTGASARAAVRSWGLAGLAPWYWLMGDRAQLRSVWRAYRIYVGPEVHGDIAHTEALYLLDGRGDERSAYLYPFMPRFVAHDLRRLSAAASDRRGA
jgi:cytochrome oxidase Cu insertion factor (SCO1/SenC/PrrC family)